MFIKSVVAVVAALATVVSAQTPPVTITQPLNAFNWTAGQTYPIAWVNPAVQTISQIWLASGSSTALSKIELVAQNVPTAPLSYSWTIDPNLPTGQYSLELGTAPNLAYAGPFTITNPTGATGAPSVAPSGAGGSSAASAPAAASSAAGSPSAAATSAAASSAASAASSAAAGSPTTAAAGSSGSSSAAPAPTTSKSGAKMVAPMAALALIPAFVAVL